MFGKLTNLPAREVQRFLFCGGVNTVFGYFSGVTFYFLFYDLIGIVWVAVLANAVSILFSYSNYRFFVFETKASYIGLVC